jgi:1-deoxy-D-xylulose-5-phosphate reductoisomerase
MQRITILGATGSIGVSTLDVLARHPERYAVYALSAHSRVDELAAQCVQFRPARAVVGTPDAAERLAGAARRPADRSRAWRAGPVRDRQRATPTP